MSISLGRFRGPAVLAALASLGLAVVGTLGNPTAGENATAFVPWPRSITPGEGRMDLTDKTRVVAADKTLLPLAETLSDELRLLIGRRPPVVDGSAHDGDIVLVLDPAFQGESYRLAVDGRATVSAGDYNGVALGTATLLQAVQSDGAAFLPRLTVEDGPRLAYPGAMLDVARKPYSIDALQQCIEVCRFYKVRYLHFHLTDENAWTFPSTAYPQLGKNNFAWAGGEKPPVYKLDELKRLVAYADARGVTLVPEIEMPGHSGQLRGALPEIFGYHDEAGKIATPGVINMVSEDAFHALDTLVGETADVFHSSPYIHIGCDEASADAAGIDRFPEVKALMAREKLDSTAAVFNAFVNRMQGIVKKHGKRMIVWEGAPLGPKAPSKDLIVMPWVGGSTAAADLIKSGYTVINAPWGVDAPYFDPYQVNGAKLAHGEPLLLGATSILWQSSEEAAVPFLRTTGALRNEPTYNPDAGRGYEDFLRRARVTDATLDRLLNGFTFQADGVLDPRTTMRLEPAFTQEATLTLSTALPSGKVRYTLDGGEPTADAKVYAGPIRLHKRTTVRARWFGDDGESLPAFVRTYFKLPAVPHDAVGARVTIIPAHPGYPGPGPKGLTDGLLADGDESSSSGWIGWQRGDKVEATLDLGRSKKITSLGAHFLRAAGGIVFPSRVEWAVSGDGKAFHPIASVTDREGAKGRGWYTATVEATTAQWVRMTATPAGDWTFLDEVAVNPPTEAPTVHHAALGKPVTLSFTPAAGYNLPGPEGLTDGFMTRSPDFLNPQWLGIEGKDFDAVIDLGQPTDIHEVGVHFLQNVGAGIRIPSTVDVLVSDDGKEYRKAAAILHKQDDRSAYTELLTATLKPVKARYVRIVARTNGQWLFADEALVNPEPEEGP